MSGAAYRLASDVQAVLSRSVVAGNRLTLPPEQLDRQFYFRVAKAIELMGGKWDKKQRAHLFEDDAEAVVADAIATGTVLDFRKHFQFFETPTGVAARLVELAGIRPGMSVLEPSAGRGRIVMALRAAGVEPVACELEFSCRMRLQELGVTLIGVDFLQLRGYQFDRIVANPPFARGQDVEHVAHMRRLLNPGGRLVSVMSPGWTFRQDRRHAEFRAAAEAESATWTPLEPGSFVESGTGVNAGVIAWGAPR